MSAVAILSNVLNEALMRRTAFLQQPGAPGLRKRLPGSRDEDFSVGTAREGSLGKARAEQNSDLKLKRKPPSGSQKMHAVKSRGDREGQR